MDFKSFSKNYTNVKQSTDNTSYQNNSNNNFNNNDINNSTNSINNFSNNNSSFNDFIKDYKNQSNELFSSFYDKYSSMDSASLKKELIKQFSSSKEQGMTKNDLLNMIDNLAPYIDKEQLENLMNLVEELK